MRASRVANPRPGLGILTGETVGADQASTVTTKAEGRLPLAEVPFAWQQGRRLLLLDEERRGWTFAELRFEDGACRYVEVRRATFGWPREAAGALLARGVAFGSESMERLAGALDRWLAVHRSASRPDDAAGS